MDEFAAIDFETANRSSSSVCSVGMAIVRGGKICETFYSLIHPEPDYYEYFNTRVHNLTSSDTLNAPAFPEVWGKIHPKIEGLSLVAHNAAFDSRCLKSVFKTYSLDWPDYEFLCTCKAARKYFKSMPACLRPPDAKLDTLARYFNLDAFNHHNALDDAIVCANIALKIL